MTKTGANNSHRVIDKLARYKGDNIRALATVHLSEALSTSTYENSTDDHTHQWMDQNGWEYRKVILQDKNGAIYEAKLNIARGRDRNILYDINKIRRIDAKKRTADGVVPSAQNGRGSLINSGSDKKITQKGGGVKQFSVAEGTQAETEGQEVAERDVRETVPAKARGYLERAERGLVNKVGELMQVPRFARREYLQNIAREMSREYLKDGSVSQETRDELFEEAYARGVEVDREFYDEYKGLKRRLRETPVTISEADQPDVRGYDTFEQFRQAAFGTLRLIKEGATPVDTVYQELSDTYPELFPASIAHPADQIVRMFEVGRSIEISEKTLDEALGPNAKEYKACPPVCF